MVSCHTHICDLILIFSKQEGHHIKLYSSSKRPLQISYVCFLQSTIYMNPSKLMTEHGHDHSCTIFLEATFVGGTFSLWLDTPYNLIVPSILTEGKIFWRDACKLWIFYFLKMCSVFMFVEWICMFSLILISQEVLNFETIKQK